MSKVFRQGKFWTNSPAAAGGNTFRIASTGNFPGCGAFADFREMFCAAPFRAVLSTPATFSWLETPNNGPIIIKIGQWLSKTANLANVEAALGLCFNILCSQNFLESWTFGKGHEEEGLTDAGDASSRQVFRVPTQHHTRWSRQTVLTQKGYNWRLI